MPSSAAPSAQARLLDRSVQPGGLARGATGSGHLRASASHLAVPRRIRGGRRRAGVGDREPHLLQYGCPREGFGSRPGITGYDDRVVASRLGDNEGLRQARGAGARHVFAWLPEQAGRARSSAGGPDAPGPRGGRHVAAPDAWSSRHRSGAAPPGAGRSNEVRQCSKQRMRRWMGCDSATAGGSTMEGSTRQLAHDGREPGERPLLHAPGTPRSPTRTGPSAGRE